MNYMNITRFSLLIFLIILSVLSFSYCESGYQKTTDSIDADDTVSVEFAGYEVKVEDRTEITRRLQEKMRLKKPIVIHALVPLCDNIHQGIVPVNDQLGDGKNVKTNLYWGAGYGVKSYFKKYGGWKMVHSESDTSADVIERVIFHKKTTSGVPVFLVADGYRGDRMKTCLHHYFSSLGGWKKGSDSAQNNLLPLYADADLLIFNGHDGLMDDTLKKYYSKDSIARETVTIACYAKSFFNPRFEKCGAYPLVGTSGLLAPEAYVLDAVIENWLLQRSTLEIKNAAGDAYHGKHPSTSQKGARALFTTGW